MSRISVDLIELDGKLVVAGTKLFANCRVEKTRVKMQRREFENENAHFCWEDSWQQKDNGRKRVTEMPKFCRTKQGGGQQTAKLTVSQSERKRRMIHGQFIA